MVKVQALNKEATLLVIFFPGLTTKSCLLGLESRLRTPICTCAQIVFERMFSLRAFEVNPPHSNNLRF